MSGRFLFGEFVLDGDTRELRRGRNVVAISPKAFQLLEILIANQPKAMSKAALQELLWPKTFVVEKNVANLVAEIREALEDSAEQPRFIRTV
jgi:DNA-binding winged helix-turn-helix (wHTH) protein